jgi:hypothetical protein
MMPLSGDNEAEIGVSVVVGIVVVICAFLIWSRS